MHCMDNAQDTRYRWAGWGVTTTPRIMMVGDTQQLLQQSHVGLHNWNVHIWRRMYSNQCPVRWAVAQGHHIITWLNRRQLNLQGFTQLDARQSMCLVVRTLWLPRCWRRVDCLPLACFTAIPARC